MSRIAVIGAGASGLVAAYFAAVNGNEVHIFEKNEKCGKKIYLTGKAVDYFMSGRFGKFVTVTR